MTNNIGHNSINQETAKLLKSFIDGIENYENQKKDLSESIKEIFDEAKVRGFCVKTIRKILKERKKPTTDEEQYFLDTYNEALEQLPLFNK